MDSLTAHQDNGLPKLQCIQKDAKLSPMVSKLNDSHKSGILKRKLIAIN